MYLHGNGQGVTGIMRSRHRRPGHARQHLLTHNPFVNEVVEGVWDDVGEMGLAATNWLSVAKEITEWKIK